MLRHKSSPRVSKRVDDGLYPPAEAAQLLHVQPAMVRRWSRVLAGAWRKETNTAARPMANETRSKQSAWSFLDLVDLLFVERFMSDGWALREVASLAEKTAAQLGTAHPFAARRFKDQYLDALCVQSRNGTNAASKDTSETIDGRCNTLSDILGRLFDNLDFDGSTHAVRYWPLGRDGRVVLDPKRKFGRPIDDETGMAIRTLFDATVAGGGQDEQVVAEWFDVPLEAVQSAVRFELELRGK